MVKKHLADNPAVQARVEAVMARMDEEELQALANHAAKIDTQNIVPNAPLGTMPAKCTGCSHLKGIVNPDHACMYVPPVILPVEATLKTIQTQLDQLAAQSHADDTLEYQINEARSHVRVALVMLKRVPQ